MDIELTMKKAGDSKTGEPWNDELASEYQLDYRKSRPNRFAGRVQRDAVVVVLDPDVAAVFRDPTRVNLFLRAAIQAVENGPSEKTG